MTIRHRSPRFIAVLCSLALAWPVAAQPQHTPLIEQAEPAKDTTTATQSARQRRNTAPPPPPAPAPTPPPAPLALATTVAETTPPPPPPVAAPAPPAPAPAPVVVPAPAPAERTYHAPPAPVAAAPVALGQTTRNILRMQAEGTHAGRALPMLGEAASRSYQRYLESFNHPIPEFFETTVPTDQGQSSGR